MAKLSVIIPSRDERFLIPTIRDVFSHSAGEIEVVAVIDSDKWPENWQQVVAEFPNLHTIHNGKSIGMRGSINRGVASAKSRGAKYVMKSDGHCSFSEGFDEVLKKNIEPNWVVVPRRGRLDPENWVATDTHKPDIDYHYLSFPDDPNDFGGPGLNGKVWIERAIERKDILVDTEMSSQGSCWVTHIDYFYKLELMDEVSYGPFWNEMQEIGLKCWLSGGQLMVNKNARYLHLHKGSKYGRGYRLDESALKQGRNYTMKWLRNEAWSKQTLPFKTLIERFWPVPTWPENWEELVYGKSPNNHRWLQHKTDGVADLIMKTNEPRTSLTIHSAHYGIGGDDDIDVTEQMQSLVQNGSLDLTVTNDSLKAGNPFRGQKKRLRLTYSYDGGEPVTIERGEREWLIIGQSAGLPQTADEAKAIADREMKRLLIPTVAAPVTIVDGTRMSATALTDLLIRRFKIPDRRLRGPMPIDLRNFHRNDLAKLFAELGFTKGVEVGVAEGHFSEVLCKSIPNLELLCVDPWHRYSGNPWAHSQEHQDFSKAETERKLKGYNAKLIQDYSMNAVRDVPEDSLDFCYIDGNHFFDYCMGDLIEWSKRVRSGGIVALDDFYHFKRTWGGVVEAVQAYTNAHKITLWFAIDAPQSVDVFWVRP